MNVTKTLNSTHNQVVGYWWNFSDNAGNWNNTDIQTLTVSSAPTYSNMGWNSTIAGAGIELSLYVTDFTALHPNGGFIFCTDNTGVLTNSSFQNFAATPQWANFSMTLNDTRAVPIGYKWYLKDNAGYWTETPTHYILPTTYTTNLTRLHADGINLKNSTNHIQYLEGVGLDPSLIAQELCAWDRTMHEDLMVEKNVEIVRIFICYGWWTGEYTEYGFEIDNETYKAGIDEIVANLTDNDIYCWICLEGSYAKQTEWGIDPANWTAWSQEIAYRYESSPSMMGIELHNEPALDYWSGNYYIHAEEVAEAIHDVDSTLITLVNTGIHGWNNFDSNFPIDEPNTIYCHHMYYQWMSETLKNLYADGNYTDAKIWLENYLTTYIYWLQDEDSGYPIMDTEFGVMRNETTFPAWNVFLQDYIDIMEEYNVTWTYFCWDSDDRVNNYSCWWEDWSEPSPQGEIVFANIGDEGATYYYLNITSGTGGTTVPTAGEHAYLNATYASVEAFASVGSGFANWTIDGGYGGTDNPTSIYMTANHTIQPVFNQISYIITLTPNPTFLLQGETVSITASATKNGETFTNYIMNVTKDGSLWKQNVVEANSTFTDQSTTATSHTYSVSSLYDSDAGGSVDYSITPLTLYWNVPPANPDGTGTTPPPYIEPDEELDEPTAPPDEIVEEDVTFLVVGIAAIVLIAVALVFATSREEEKPKRWRVQKPKRWRA